eukprot:Hpha_TRINITY_DN15857_c3_g1::TRINITY_DN15857_c3_g1_i2::g.190635::m.190635
MGGGEPHCVMGGDQHNMQGVKKGRSREAAEKPPRDSRETATLPVTPRSTESRGKVRSKKPGRVVLPITLLFAVSGVVSTCVSVIGGVLLYMESVAAVRDAMHHVADAESAIATERLSAYFVQARDDSELAIRYVSKGAVGGNLEQLQEGFRALQTAMITTTRRINGYGWEVIPNITEPRNAVRVTSYWDPLSDPVEIAKNGGSDREIIVAQYSPELPGNCGNKSLVGQRCMMAHTVSEEGTNLVNIYNYTRKFLTKGLDRVDELTGPMRWFPVASWLSRDGTIYYYVPLRMWAKNFKPDSPVLSGAVEFTSYVMLYDWGAELGRVTTDRFLVVLDVSNGLDGAVYASSRGDVTLCGARAAGMNNCTLKIREYDRKTQEAAVAANKSAAGTFLQADLDGETHWLMRRVVWAGQEGLDTIGEIDLLWMTDTKSSEGRVMRSLIYFVTFVAAVIVFDGLILVFEVIKVGLPLRKISQGMSDISTMNLEHFENTVASAGGGSIVVGDILAIIDALRGALRALKLYRDFLPQGLLTELEGDASSDHDTSYTFDRKSESKSLSSSFGPASVVSESIPQSSLANSCQSNPLSGTERQISGAPFQLVKDDKASSCSSKQSSNPSSAASLRLQTRKGDLSRRLLHSFDSRNAGILVLNLIGTHDLRRDKIPTSLRHLVQAIHGAASRKGVIDIGSGDRIRMSWNSCRPVVRPAFHAAETSVRIRDDLTAEVACTSMALCFGDAVCTTTGESGFRYVSLIGGVVSFVHSLERVSAEMCKRDARSVTLCDVRTQLEAKSTFVTRWEFSCLFSKMGTRPQSVWEIIETRTKGATTDEWMYQMEKEEQADHWRVYNAAVGLCRGDLQEALSLLKEPRSSPLDGSEPVEFTRRRSELLTRIEKAIAGEGKHPLEPQMLVDVALRDLPPQSAGSFYYSKHGSMRRKSNSRAASPEIQITSDVEAGMPAGDVVQSQSVSPKLDTVDVIQGMSSSSDTRVFHPRRSENDDKTHS